MAGVDDLRKNIIIDGNTEITMFSSGGWQKAVADGNTTIEMEEKIDKMRKLELQLLIIEFNKASQLDRSFSKTNLSNKKKKEFRKKLLENCLYLMGKIDKNILKNADIRDKIKELAEIDNNISFGQAQKVINVSLKQYCFICNNKQMLKELDCPLDTTTMKGYRIYHNRMIDVTEDDYKKYQYHYEQECNGIRILKDCQYDKMRISEFLST